METKHTNKNDIDNINIANPPPGEEIVISGLSGHYPDSHDVYHFRDNLYNKVDLVSEDCRRWEPTHPEIPTRTGKIHHINKFDAGFFGISHSQTHCMDPMVRLILERSVEAIFDAGIHPSELEGTNTGVFIGVCFSESEKTWFFDKVGENGYAATGCERSMIAHRVSYFLKLEGPSYIVDTACSSSLYALEHAYRAIRMGKCDRAIVGGANVCLHPFVSLQFARLGVLSMDGSCKSFDSAGNGYARSEAICVVILQKAKDARRLYSTLIHAKTNCDGYKEQGITYPSGEMQRKLLQEFYDECNVDPSILSFLEAHGTGTKVGDPEEVTAIDEIFCKKRKRPLMIGSVKSNIGHSEPSSGLCSITKCIIGMEHGYIPPNIHYKTPREGVKPLEDGKLKVVVEKTPFEDDRGLLGVNSFGFGGGNAHVLLRWNEKRKINKGQPKDNLPRLVLLSGRTEKAVSTFSKHVVTNNCDVEYIRLLHQLFSKDINGHLYRGYVIVSKTGEVCRDCDYFSGKKTDLYLAFGSFSKSWKTIAEGLLGYPIFVASLQRIHNTIASLNVNIMEIIAGLRKTSFDLILGSISVALALVEIFKIIGLKPRGYFGTSFGEIICAYYDGILSLEETILTAFVIGKNVQFEGEETMYCKITLNLEQINQILPQDIEVVSIVSKNIAIIGGPASLMKKFLDSLRQVKVEIKIIGTDIFGVSSRIVLKNRQVLIDELNKVIRSPRKWSNFHISGDPDFTVESLVNHIVNPLLLKDILGEMGRHSIVIDLETGFLVQALEETDFKCLDLAGNTKKYSFANLIQFIGRLYVMGHNPEVDKLYPRISYPVSRGTPMISPSIRWDWSNDWHVTRYNADNIEKSGEKIVKMTLKDDHWLFMKGHVVDGRNLIPATGYLQIVWETLAHVKAVLISDMKVIFENCKFYRATNVPKDTSLELTVMLQRGTGNFEVIESDQAIVKGRIRAVSNFTGEQIDLPLPVGLNDEDNLPMMKKDIYKELRLRGYNYKGDFREIQECNAEATRGSIKWNGNWINFMDNMLQMKILQVDTRLLYVPTGIKRLTIDSKKHMELCKSLGENPNVPVYVFKDLGIIRSGAIEIQGLNASSIAVRKPLGDPVLEKYEFVPNHANLKTHQSIRVNTQIILENLWSIKVKVVEFLDEATDENLPPLSTLILEVLGDQPLIQPNITVLSKNCDLKLKDITVEDRKLITETDCHLVVGSNIIRRLNVHHPVFGALKENGFVLSREPLDLDLTTLNQTTLVILTVHKTENETIVMCRKKCEVKKPIVVDVADKNFQFAWLENLKSSVKNDGHVIAYAQNEPLSGILGLVNCLRREPGGANVKSFFIADKKAPPFDIDDNFYSQQLKKNLGVNVFKNGLWGTYRHLLMEESPEVDSEHCFVNVTTRGDLSSLRWIEGPLRHDMILKPENTLVHIYYAALNFRDVMTATGRINVDVITQDRTAQECVQGFEFSGRETNGRRVMGMVVHGALSTILSADTYLLWDVPDVWSLEEAATIPVVYGTALYALITRANMKRGDKVLIHSGTGGVGQAAIHYALHAGCQVFTTVGTQEKREFLKKRHPQLKDCHIGNSRDTSFETLIMTETKGLGVDIILNSLAEEKLQASVRCLAKGGRFLEIGKFDLASDNQLHLQFLDKEASFHGIMLDQLFSEDPILKKNLAELITEGIYNGSVVPLMRTVFKDDEMEGAFRFMTSGKHIGKVLLKVRQEEPEREAKPKSRLFKGIPRYFCDAEKSYVIAGGLGGFGLELADWLVLRGARLLVLTSRSGVKTGYQSLRIRTWKTYGVTIKISTADIRTKEGCIQLINEAEEMGQIEGIFNLAVVLKDAILENQNQELFKTSFEPKAIATLNLDEVTRKMCPHLRDFVIFSSVSCGRGNAGQTNYGMANSVMERVCERRRNDGYPALAIEWGAIGEVGLVAEMQEEHFEMEIGGTLQQRISSCLKVLDIFLRQNSPIVSSMVVAEKRGNAGMADNVVDAVANILGIRDLMSISLHATLAELGMDSMTAVEIKQTLEREFDVYLTAQDIRSMTFARLREIQTEKETDTEGDVKKDKALVGMDMLIRLMGDEEQINIPVLHLPSKLEDIQGARKVLLFPGVEGVATVLTPLAKKLEAETIGLQYCYDEQADALTDMAQKLLSTVKQHLTKEEPFIIIGYSFGAIMALEVIGWLEKEGYEGKFISIDGAPSQLIEFTHMLDIASEAHFETSLVLHLMALHVPYEVISKSREAIFKCNTFEDRIRRAQEIAGKDSPHSPEHQRMCAIAVYKRIKGLLTYKPTYTEIKAKAKLFKPKQNSMHVLKDDYKLSETLGQEVPFEMIEGNHVTMLENEDLADKINKIINGDEAEVVEDLIVEKMKEPLLVDPGLRMVEVEAKNI